jgi:DNA-binding LacI/PurR family transcriptional regulator
MLIDKNRCKLLALILPSLDGPCPQDILRGFEKAAGAAGYGLLVAVSADAQDEIEKISRAVACGAAGVVLLPCAGTKLTAQTLGKWAGEGVYISAVERNPGFDPMDFVGCDNRGGGFMAADHMHQNGFDQVVFVTDSPQSFSVQERFEGFRKGIGQFGMKLLNEDAGEGKAPDLAACGSGAFADRLELYRANQPFAVFASNDQTAARVMALIRENGADLNSEIGIIGFGNSEICDITQPKLTSVAQNGARIGETAAKLAAEKIESGDKQVVRHILPAQLVERKSCGES